MPASAIRFCGPVDQVLSSVGSTVKLFLVKDSNKSRDCYGNTWRIDDHCQIAK